MTNEHNCPLSAHCKVAGVEGVCTEQCGAFISVMSRYKVSGVPRGYSDVFLDNSPARDDQADIYAILDEYVRTFTKDDTRVKNMYLYSKSPGTGKTTTGIALLHEYIRRRFMYYTSRRQAVPEALGLFLDVNEYQTEYNLANLSNDDDKLGELAAKVDRYSNVEFLVIDDVGVRSATESFRALVHAIINRRLTNELPTVFTSNIPMSDLGQVFDDRLQDRIADQCLEVAFKGTSKRGRR